jgi:membrane protein YdbS with pleckstrin-like domain
MIKFEEGEQNLKVIRRHWLVILPVLIGALILALAPLLLFYIFTSYLIQTDNFVAKENIIQFQSFVTEWQTFLYTVWLLLLWVFFFIEWTDYYLDLWVITDRRIIDVEQKGFFHREVTSFAYNQIQDITVETKGLLETFLKFGTLHIQTAGHNRDIIIKSAQNPEEARSLILKIQGKL